MPAMRLLHEDHVEQAALQWLSSLGWEVTHRPDISPPDAKTPGSERDSDRQVCPPHRLQAAIRRPDPPHPRLSTGGPMSDTVKAMLLHDTHSPEANSLRPARCK